MLKKLLEASLKLSGLSAREVSSRAGLNPTTLSRWITGLRREPRLADALAVGAVLGIPERTIVRAFREPAVRARARARRAG